MPSSWVRHLIRIAKAVLSQVISTVNQQQNIVEQQIEAQLRQMVSEVVGGVWTGDDADAFVDEMESVVIPQAGNLIIDVLGIRNSVEQAMQIMDEADNQVAQMADAVSDTFSAIY